MTDNAPFSRCGRCSAPLDVPGRPWSLNCGGDCIACMAEVGDPDCVKPVAAMRASEAVVKAARALHRTSDDYSTGGRVGVLEDALRALWLALPPETRAEKDPQ